jgi:hypothetical protein
LFLRQANLISRRWPRAALRAEHLGREPEARDALGQRQPACQCGAGLAHGGRGLDAVAALRRHPEEAGRTGLEAADQVAVGHEGAQAGPGARGAADGQRGRLLDAVHGDGDVHLLGLDVLRLDRVGIGRRAEQHAGVGLDVPALVGTEHHGPVRHALALGRREDEGRAAARLDAQRRHARQRATVSTHAPAALSTTGASYTLPPAVTRQRSPTRSMAVTPASHTSWPPARRMPRR